ncbi:MAG: thiamine diphosphokinase [Sphaerochaetaceae bacterium]
MESCALLFTGGEGPSVLNPKLLPPYSYVCAADSGIEGALALGFSIDEAIGDFDSLKDPALLTKLNFTRLPRAKDVSDTEAALILLKERGFHDYLLIGGGGRRFDHLLHLYSLFEKYGPPKLWLTAREESFLVKESTSRTFPLNSVVSVIPALANGHSEVTSVGLYWPLDKFSISMEKMSLSNRVVREKVELRVKGDPVFLVKRV